MDSHIAFKMTRHGREPFEYIAYIVQTWQKSSYASGNRIMHKSDEFAWFKVTYNLQEPDIFGALGLFFKACYTFSRVTILSSSHYEGSSCSLAPHAARPSLVGLPITFGNRLRSLPYMV